MNRVIGILMSVFFMVGVAFADPYHYSAKSEKDKELEKDESILECPETLLKMEFKNCKDCHLVPSWKVKKSKPFAEYEASLPYGVHLRKCNSEVVVYVKLDDIKDDVIDEAFNFAEYNDIKKMVLEVHSPGGSLFNAQRIVGMMDAYKYWGGTIETRINGWAASAGFYIFINGDKRLVSPTAQLMWHELKTFDLFKISGPSDTEDEARVLRHLQDTVNQWISERCSFTKDELDDFVNKKELWLNGQQAFEKGVATGLIVTGR